MNDQIPHLKGQIFYGSFADLRKDRFSLLMRLARCGGVASCHFGPLLFVCFSRPEYIQSVLSEHANKTDKGSTQHRAFPPGLFISEGSYHHRQRKAMAPSFSPREVATYADEMAKYSKKTAEAWTKRENEALINISREMGALTTSIVGKVLFDQDVFDESSDLNVALGVVFRNIAFLINYPFGLPGSFPTPRHLERKKAWNVIQSRVQRMIDDRRSSDNTQGRIDFLSRLMQARDEDGNAMSDQELINECMTLFTAGQETVANGLTWTWYLLAQHPEIYQKVQSEIDSVLNGRTPTFTDLVNLPYCLQVFKEALRLYPPASAVIRQAREDIIVHNDQKDRQFYLKKGTFILASIYGIHHDAGIYPDPERFDPEHFSPDAEKTHHRYAYMPFGAGPRICIGNHFALMEGQILLATLAQHVRQLALIPDQHIYPSSRELTTRSAQDIIIQMRMRDRQKG